jgi:hypothetical protein
MVQVTLNVFIQVTRENLSEPGRRLKCLLIHVLFFGPNKVADNYNNFRVAIDNSKRAYCYDSTAEEEISNDGPLQIPKSSEMTVFSLVPKFSHGLSLFTL